MSVVREVLEELWSMFVGDRRLTLLLLAVVALAAVTAFVLPIGDAATRHAVTGAILLIGAFAVLADCVFRAARKARG